MAKPPCTMQDCVNVHYVHMHMYFQCMSVRLFSFLSVFLSKTEPVSIHAPHTRFETTMTRFSETRTHSDGLQWVSDFLCEARSLSSRHRLTLAVSQNLRASRLLFWPSYTHAAFSLLRKTFDSSVWYKEAARFLSCAVRVVKHVGFDSEVGSPHKTSMLFKYLNHF